MVAGRADRGAAVTCRPTRWTRLPVRPGHGYGPAVHRFRGPADRSLRTMRPAWAGKVPARHAAGAVRLRTFPGPPADLADRAVPASLVGPVVQGSAARPRVPVVVVVLVGRCRPALPVVPRVPAWPVAPDCRVGPGAPVAWADAVPRARVWPVRAARTGAAGSTTVSGCTRRRVGRPVVPATARAGGSVHGTPERPGAPSATGVATVSGRTVRRRWVIGPGLTCSASLGGATATAAPPPRRDPRGDMVTSPRAPTVSVTTSRAGVATRRVASPPVGCPTGPVGVVALPTTPVPKRPAAGVAGGLQTAATRVRSAVPGDGSVATPVPARRSTVPAGDAAVLTTPGDGTARPTPHPLTREARAVSGVRAFLPDQARPPPVFADR